MQQFTVPQFIDVEDKIIGPLTTRQFMIILGSFMIIGISYKMFDFSLFLFVGIIVFACSGVLAFFKVNGMPFHFFVLNFIYTIKRSGIRVWNNEFGKQAIDKKFEAVNNKIAVVPVPIKHVTTSRLAELSLIVDTQGAYQGGKSQEGKDIKQIYDLKI